MIAGRKQVDGMVLESILPDEASQDEIFIPRSEAGDL